MEINRQLIIDFFENKCSAEEAEQVYHYLQQHPEVVSAYLDETAWENFQTTAAQEDAMVLKRFENIQANKIKVKPFIAWKRILQVAAAILLLLAVTRIVMVNSRHVPAPIAAIPSIPKPVDHDTIIANKTDFEKRVVLSDASVVRLAAQSVLALHQPFGPTERNIQLAGEAIFYVAKDNARPFTVYTPGFSTTALGTVFRIKAYTRQTNSSVKLLEGKILVRNLKSAEQPKILEAGDVCIFDAHANVLIKQHTEEKPVQQSIISKIKKTDNSITEDDQAIAFRNAPLPKVLEVISRVYHISITSGDQQLNKRKFTGSFKKEQSIESVLQTIASLNDLTIIPDEAGYQVTQQ